MALRVARMRAMRSRACMRISCRRRGMTLDFRVLSLILRKDSRNASKMIRPTLLIERLGPLPIVNHCIARMKLDDALARHVPSDQRCVVPHARALGVLLAVGQAFALKFDEFHNDSLCSSEHKLSYA